MSLAKYVFLMFCVSTSLSDCLAGATLEKLFKKDAIKAAAKIDAPTVCKDVFKSAGACVTEDEAKAKLTE